MEEVVGLVTVADEGVTCFAIPATVHHRMSSGQILTQQRIPVLGGEIALLGKAHVRTEAEVVDERGTCLCVKSATFYRTILHVTGHTALIHQRGHGIDLCRGTGISQFVRHIAKIETRLGEVDFKASVIVAIIIVTTPFQSRFPEFDHLCHSRGDTTRPHMTVRSLRIRGTEGIVVLSLIPGGGDQRFDAFRQTGCTSRRLPFYGCLAPATVGGRLHLSSQVIEEPLDVIRQFEAAVGLYGEALTEAVAQHLLCLVVSTDNDKGIVAHIDDVECCAIGFRHHLSIDDG